MGGVGSGSGGLFGPRFPKEQRDLVQASLNEAGGEPDKVNLAALATMLHEKFGYTRGTASLNRLLHRLAKGRRSRKAKKVAERKPLAPSTGQKRGSSRVYEGPTRFSPEEEQAIVSVAPDCVITESTIDYDAIIRKLNEKFPARCGKWNRDGIRAILKRHGVYDRLLQGERPVPVVVRPPSDALEHLKLQKEVLEQRMDRVRDEFASLDRAHTRVHLAIEAYESNIGVCGLRDIGAALREFHDSHPPEEGDPGGHA